MREKITVIVPMYNVEDRIAECLESVKWADEIIAVDSFSTDQTIQIAKNYTDKVLQHKYKSYAQQNNWALDYASHPWVMVVDSDERVSTELKEEIIMMLEKETNYNAYRIKRQNYFLGKKVRFCGWQKDEVRRLFKKNFARFSDSQVHPKVEVDGTVGKLKSKLLHYPAVNLGDFLEKTQRYALWAAKDRAKKTKKVRWYHLTLRPGFRFFKQYVLRLGFLDGITGLVICSIATYSVFLKYAMLWEMQKQNK